MKAFIISVVVGVLWTLVLWYSLNSTRSKDICTKPVFYLEPNHALLATPERTPTPSRKGGSRVLETSLVGGPWENQ